MSVPSSPGKSSLTSWWKNFTKEGQTSPPPPLNLNSNNDSSSNSSSHHHHLLNHTGNSTSLPFPNPQSTTLSPSNSTGLSTPARPFLGYKSRSSHSMRPISSYLDSSSNPMSQEKLKARRDSFLQQRQLDHIGNSVVFGTLLEDSINIAEGRIYISSDSDGLVVYGRIPRVIASCGLYLKKNGLDIEGIFRLSGSTKRIKQLQLIFSTAPDYGSKVDWDGFTVHDAASLLRRFLGSLPEPLIPLSLYESFREPLKSRPMIVKYLKDKEKRMTPNASVEDHDTLKNTTTNRSTDNEHSNTTTKDLQMSEEDEETKRKKKKARKQRLIQERRNALKEYAELFDKLPELQRQLLFYILDLLAIFNSHSDKNLMPAKNLAAIFQPSILSHTDHDMSPEEYALSSLVIEFMIEYSYKILPAAQESVKLAAKNNPKKNKTIRSSIAAPSQSKDDTLLPPKTSYVTRKHSKSLSSVRNPDIVRVSTNHPNKSKPKLTQTMTNNTTDDNLDSTVETEDEMNIHQQLEKQLSITTDHHITTTDSNAVVSPRIKPVIVSSSAPQTSSMSKIATPVTTTTPISSITSNQNDPPNIKIDSPVSLSSPSSGQQSINPVISSAFTNQNQNQNQNSITTSSPHKSTASSPTSLSFLHSITSKNPLKILSSPRLRASSIDDTLSKDAEPLASLDTTIDNARKSSAAAETTKGDESTQKEAALVTTIASASEESDSLAMANKDGAFSPPPPIKTSSSTTSSTNGSPTSSPNLPSRQSEQHHHHHLHHHPHHHKSNNGSDALSNSSPTTPTTPTTSLTPSINQQQQPLPEVLITPPQRPTAAATQRKASTTSINSPNPTTATSHRKASLSSTTTSTENAVFSGDESEFSGGERESRWDHESKDSSNGGKKKGHWFNKLRSRSNSKV